MISAPVGVENNKDERWRKRRSPSKAFQFYPSYTHVHTQAQNTHTHTYTQAGPTDALINGGEQSGQMVAT